jgi:hypothetical protein
MRRRGETNVVPRRDEQVAERLSSISPPATCSAPAAPPKQGESGPWRLKQSYTADLMNLRFGRLDDGVLEFSR